jgi:uncharacterized UPF0160 family protein
MFAAFPGSRVVLSQRRIIMSNTTTTTTTKTTTIARHPGVFHADDVFCVAALLRVCPGAEVVATPAPGPEFDLVVDVGGVHEPLKGRFDHHQPNSPVRENGVPYAAFGLLMAHDGWAMDILGAYGVGSSQREIRGILDVTLIQGIDAQDNGWKPRIILDAGDGQGVISFVDGWARPGDKFSYHRTAVELPGNAPGDAYSISRAVSAFNPTWDSEQSREDAFMEAVDWADGVLKREIGRIKAGLLARSRVLAAPTGPGRTLLLGEFMPWQEHIYARPDQMELLYVVYPSLRGGYCVQQVPEEPGGLRGRKPLPQAWRGLRGKALEEATGLDLGGDDPSVFCHAGGFIAGATTVEAAVALAELSAQIGEG